jgi:hypothetical protein
MTRYKIGDTVVVDGRPARVVWLSENASEIEAMDEYIVEFENRERQFLLSSALGINEWQAMHNREHNRDPRSRQTH